MDALRIGILGAARIAPAAVVRPARRTKSAIVAAVAARDPARAAAFARKQGIARVHATYEQLVADPDIDAIYNPLPNGLHGRWTIAALEAGKAVLCEKPFTSNAEEAQRVAEVAERTGLVVSEAFHYLYHPLARRMVDIVRGGEIGPVGHIDIAFSAPLVRPRDIRYRLDLAGGAMMDMGCYTVSLVRLLTADEPTVTQARAKESSVGVDRAMSVDLTIPGGGTATIACSMFSSSVFRMNLLVSGDAGELRVLNPFAPQFGHRLKVRTSEGRRIERVTRRATYDFQLEAFVGAVRGGASVPTSPTDAIANMKVIDAVYEASGLGIRQPTV